MEKKYKVAGVGNILCAVLFASSYAICTYIFKTNHEVNDGVAGAVLVLLVLAMISYASIPPLFIGFILLALMLSTPLAPYVPWGIAAIVLTVGIWELATRKPGLGTKILLVIGMGLKGPGILIIAYYGLGMLFSASPELVLPSILTWTTVASSLVSIILDCVLFGKQRDKKKRSEKKIS